MLITLALSVGGTVTKNFPSIWPEPELVLTVVWRGLKTGDIRKNRVEA
jgi:hypothetical protein